jgi:hypothetical protein
LIECLADDLRSQSGQIAQLRAERDEARNELADLHASMRFVLKSDREAILARLRAERGEG